VYWLTVDISAARLAEGVVAVLGPPLCAVSGMKNHGECLSEGEILRLSTLM
jgi:hypothetical protein